MTDARAVGPFFHLHATYGADVDVAVATASASAGSRVGDTWSVAAVAVFRFAPAVILTPARQVILPAAVTAVVTACTIAFFCCRASLTPAFLTVASTFR